MTAQFPTPKIVDLVTTLDSRPKITANGVMLWATVEMIYATASVSPKVTIRVPLPWSPDETEAERSRQALRYARELIDHACAAMTPAPSETGPGLLEGTILEGLSQELGFSRPTSRPARSRGHS